MDARYIDALAASARCSAGEFIIAGRKLLPLSLTHAALLDALKIPLWTTSNAASNFDYLTCALICSCEGAGGIPLIGKLDEIGDDFANQFDLAQDPETWRRYVAACYDARPIVPLQMDGTEGTQRHGPFEEFIVDFILSNSTGYTRWQLIEDMPAALVFWIFEAVRERLTGGSRIITEEELAESLRVKTPQELAKEKADEKTAAAIVRKFSDTKKQIELLTQLNEGTLPKNWRKTHAR